MSRSGEGHIARPRIGWSNAGCVAGAEETADELAAGVVMCSEAPPVLDRVAKAARSVAPRVTFTENHEIGAAGVMSLQA